MSKIPIKNIYYMLCYAWDILEEANKIHVDLDSFEQESNLLGKLLNAGLNHQLRQGIYRDYVETSECLGLIRGKINFSESFKKLAFPKAKAICSFDNYSENNIYNQLIKTALDRILRTEHIEKKLANEIKQSLSFLNNVDIVEYKHGVFSTLKIPRNFKGYRLLLSISEFILKNLSQNEQTGKYQFSDFIKDDHQMRRLYEKFIYNFYLKEMRDKFKVTNSKKEYVGAEESPDIPQLVTDIELISKETDEQIILETKFTQQTLAKNRYGQEKVQSKHLMQLMTYLENRRRKTGEVYSGILLYPTIKKNYKIKNTIWGYNVSILTINLNEEWKSIHDNLIDLIDVHCSPSGGTIEKMAA